MFSDVAGRILAAVLSVLILGAMGLGWKWIQDIRDTLLWSEIPEGAVVAFDTPRGCPEGWSDLSDAMGKVIIGAGQGDTYPYRVPGGKETIDLTEKHIPAHVHGYTDAYFSESNGRRPGGSKGVSVPGKKGLKGDVDTNNVGWAVTRETDSFGYEGDNRVRHTNMQPYIALHFCVFKPDKKN